MRWTRSVLSISALWMAVIVCANRTVASEMSKVKMLLGQAEIFEQQYDWEKACEVYEAIFRLDRNAPEVRHRYVNAMRRTWQVRRHREPNFRKEVLSLEYAQALRLFGVIQDSLLDQSVDRKSVEPRTILQKGVEELSLALADPQFVQQYVPSFKVAEVRQFRDFLQRNWSDVKQLTRGQIGKQVREVTLAAQDRLQISPAVVVMELACGACYAFDDYTVYLTPTQLRELCDSLKGEYVGVGISLGTRADKLVVVEVAVMSSAAEAGLTQGDQLLSIDRKPVNNLAPEAAVDLLEGPLGSSVEVDIVSSTGMGMRKVILRRRALFMPSVFAEMKTRDVGYLHVNSFQDTTLQEVDDALMTLGEMKALVLDLRGNTGGLFEVAVEVARRFLANGVVATTQHQDPRFSTIYQARNPGALGIPLVILVDGDTASSAEVLAGALKDNKRGRLVGQTTFGKGCTQSILKLPPGPGGIPTGGLRITVSRFFSPEGLPYTGRGIAPHMFVERLLMPEGMMAPDHQIQEAILEAQRAVSQ